MKTCSCGTTGPENFYRNRSTPDGLCFYCKTCTARHRREEYARKFPNGKGKRGAKPGNQNGLIHGRYVGDHAKRYRTRPVVIPELTYLDRLIRMPLTGHRIVGEF